MSLIASPASAASTPTFKQVRAKEITSGTVNSLAFNSANTAGNLIVVYVAWTNTNTASVSDTRGNVYTSAGARTTWGATSTSSSQVFYAKNIAGGSNTVRATFATSITSWGHHLHPRVRRHRQGEPAGRERRQQGYDRRDEQRIGDNDERQRI